MRALFHKLGGKGRNMRHLIAGYISQYIGKDEDESTFNKKRYWTSKGIPVPEVQSYAHLGVDAIKAAYDCVLADGADTSTAPVIGNGERSLLRIMDVPENDRVDIDRHCG